MSLRTERNPAELGDYEAGKAAARIGAEIVRRWLKTVEPELYRHQGDHHYWNILQKNGSWMPVNGDENNRQWVPNPDQKEKS